MIMHHYHYVILGNDVYRKECDIQAEDFTQAVVKVLDKMESLKKLTIESLRIVSIKEIV